MAQYRNWKAIGPCAKGYAAAGEAANDSEVALARVELARTKVALAGAVAPDRQAQSWLAAIMGEMASTELASTELTAVALKWRAQQPVSCRCHVGVHAFTSWTSWSIAVTLW